MMEYFCCYHSYRRRLAKLSDQEVGRLFRALLEYSETGETQELAGRESIAFDFIADDIDRARKNYDGMCEKQRKNGKKGGRPKTQENPKNPSLFLKTQKRQSESESKSEYITPHTPQGIEAVEMFDTFWAAYPRKDGKAAARKKWQSLKPDEALLAHMLRAIKTMSASEQWQADGGRYIPMASTWLNQRRWEDVLPPGPKRRAVEYMEDEFDPIKALTGEQQWKVQVEEA